MQQDIQDKKGFDRRNFLKSVGRFSILGILAAGATGLILQNNNTEAQTCTVETPCQNCRKLKSCKKPEAEKAKNEKINKK